MKEEEKTDVHLLSIRRILDLISLHLNNYLVMVLNISEYDKVDQYHFRQLKILF